jgi:hypothetical protein
LESGGGLKEASGVRRYGNDESESLLCIFTPPMFSEDATGEIVTRILEEGLERV